VGKKIVIANPRQDAAPFSTQRLEEFSRMLCVLLMDQYMRTKPTVAQESILSATTMTAMLCL